MDDEKNKKTTCGYCYKEISEDELVDSRILRNHHWVDMTFCSKEHAAFYQMGCEG